MIKRFLITLLLVSSNSIFAQTSSLGDSEDFKQMQAQNQKWRKAIDDFAASDGKTVLTPYMQLISTLNGHPEQAACTDNIKGLINRALQLNSSSLVAYSMLYRCAAKERDADLKQQYLASINGIVSNLVNGAEGDTIQSAIAIREMMEARLLLQAMGFAILDMDMTTTFGGLYYRYHVMDALSSTVTVRYFTNLTFMKKLLTNPNISDDIAAQSLAGHYERQGTDFALNAKARRLIARKQYQQALEVLNSISEYSMSKNVLQAHVFLATQHTEGLKEIQRELAFDAKSGFLASAIMLANLQLAESEPADEKAIEQLLNDVDRYSKNGEGAYRLALILRQNPVEKARKLSLHYLKKAVELNHPDATLTLARIYRSDKKTNQNEAQAMALFEKAKAMGADNASVDIARYLHQGSASVEPDHVKELQLLKQLAKQENADASFILARYHEKGIDVDKDAAKARQYYQSAHQLGHKKAATALGLMIEADAATDPSALEQAFSWYQKAGSRGDSSGFLNLARFYHEGLLGTPSLSNAANYYVRAAETGSYVAYCKLADTMLQTESKASDKWQDTLARARSLYLAGVEREDKYCPRRLGAFYQFQQQDNQSAARWYEAAYLNGDASAGWSLETLYFTSFVNKNYEKALVQLDKTAAMGMPKSLYYLGQMHHLGLGTARDDKKAMNYFEKALAQDFAPAKKGLLKLYLQGNDSVRDNAKAISILDKIAAESLADTMRIAEWFFYGQDFDQDYKLALRYYQKGAELGSGNAINHLGEMYRFGWGVEADFEAAKRWYLTGMKIDYLICAHNIAEMYYYGQGTQQNYNLAYEWFVRGSDANVSHSRYFLGKMHQQGQGVAADAQSANRLFYKAMDQRHQGAKFELGKNLTNGAGIEKNIGRGMIFITEAAEAGFEEAIDYLKLNSAD